MFFGASIYKLNRFIYFRCALIALIFLGFLGTFSSAAHAVSEEEYEQAQLELQQSFDQYYQGLKGLPDHASESEKQALWKRTVEPKDQQMNRLSEQGILDGYRSIGINYVPESQIEQRKKERKNERPWWERLLAWIPDDDAPAPTKKAEAVKKPSQVPTRYGRQAAEEGSEDRNSANREPAQTTAERLGLEEIQNKDRPEYIDFYSEPTQEFHEQP